MKQVDMDFDVAIKVETVDEICDKLITVQNQQHKHELANVKGSVAIKIEPHDDWCCESSLYVDQSSLYVDHQVKDEVVIGPTELRKQSEGSFQLPSDLACNMCSKTFKHKSSFTRHMNTHNAPATSVDKCEPKLEKQSIMKKEKNVKAKSTMTRKKKVYKMADKNGEIKSVEFEGKSDNINLKQKVDNSQNKCLLCFKTFTIPNNLTRHMNQLHGERTGKPYSCDKCSMSFARSDYLIRHKLIKHADGKQIIFCKCGNKFYDKWTFTRHKKGYCLLKSSTLKLICDYCNKTFCNKYRLTEHIKKHLNNTYRILICEHCHKHFHRKCEIERHMFQHLGINLHKFKCQICNKKFTRNWSLKKHLISHTGRKPFALKIEPHDDWCCESSLYVDHQVKDEVVIGPTELRKQSEGSFQHPSDLACNICSKTFKRKGSFTRHMNTHNTPATSVEKREPKLESQGIMKKKVKAKSTITKKNKRECIIADKNGEMNHNLKRKEDKKLNKSHKSFAVPNNLTRHRNQLHYSRDKCSMSFTRSEYRIRHKLIIHAEGKHICKCGKKFYDKSACTRHKRAYCVLESSTPFKLVCDYCNKTFCNKYRLTEHIKKHLNNTYRTLICEHCHKHFHRKCEIERHMFQHLGINLHKFKCQICNKKFTRNWSLKKHLISHTGRKPFACKYCMRSFGSKWGCVCHERKFHPSEK